MTRKRSTLVGAMGGLVSVGLAWCTYPLMLFGKMNTVLWFIAMGSAVVFGLTLAYAVIMSIRDALLKRGSLPWAGVPLAALVATIIVWDRFVAYLSRMP